MTVDLDGPEPDRTVEAARWLAATPRHERGAAVPELRRRFGLNAVEACAVIREASTRKAHHQ